MEMCWIVLALTILCIRFIAPYDSRYMKGKYVSIENPKLCRLLIDRTSFFENTKRLKKDKDKITILGIVLYISSIITVVLSVLSYLFVSKSKIEPWIIETEYGDISLKTLNESYSAGFIVSFLALFVGVIGVRMFQYAKTIRNKWFRWITYIFSVVIIFASVAICGMMVNEAIN